MALEFLHRALLHRAREHSARVAVFPGAWNPPTLAHVEIARAARGYADEVIWVLPRAFPHKGFEGASFAGRCKMLEKVSRSVAISEGGLYTEIADEAQEFFGPGTEILLVCGRDAAERMATWDYGVPGVFDDMLRRYRLLVASRSGEYKPAGHHSDRILTLNMDAKWNEVSSSEIRNRIARGEDWRPLVPPAIAAMVESLYLTKEEMR